MFILKNKTGIAFDYSNLYGDGRVSENDIKELSEKIHKASLAIEKMRKTGKVKGHLSKDGLPEKVLFTQLPYIEVGNINSSSSIERILDFAENAKNKVNAIVSFGIGGSFLGNKVLFDSFCGDFWNTKIDRAGFPKLYFSGNNADGIYNKNLLENILEQARCFKKNNNEEVYNITLIVISKSGTTLETIAGFMYFFGALSKEKDLFNTNVVVVTDKNDDSNDNILNILAKDHSWEVFNTPYGVGGRFSVFSDSSMITAAATGVDIKAFLKGARAMDEVCQSDDVFSNMALLNATLKFIAAEKYGRDIEVFMPYSESLKSLSEWYAQLLAESLGKEYDRDSKKICYGRTPIVSVGTKDMHSQTQQHQEGRLNKIIQFIKIEEFFGDPFITNCFPREQRCEKFSGFNFGQILNAALDANSEALASNNRFSAIFSLPRLTPYYLGALMYMLCLSVAYEGELANVNAFDQPGVESYKKILKSKLSLVKKNFI